MELIKEYKRIKLEIDGDFNFLVSPVIAVTWSSVGHPCKSKPLTIMLGCLCIMFSITIYFGER